MNRPVVVALLAAVAALACAVPARSATTAKPWSTCKPGAEKIIGAYHFVDNDWQTRRLCVTLHGLSATIDSNVPAGNNVVAYPRWQYGKFWNSADPASGLPVPVQSLGTMTLHVRCTGHAAGQWLCDADSWFYPSGNTNRHGTFELVIANRSSGPAPSGGVWRRVFVHGQWWAFASWMTRDAQHPSVRPWRICVFRLIRQAPVDWIDFTAFAYRVLRWHLLPPADWLGTVNYAPELWSGGKGLTYSIRVDWPHLGTITEHHR